MSFYKTIYKDSKTGKEFDDYDEFLSFIIKRELENMSDDMKRKYTKKINPKYFGIIKFDNTTGEDATSNKP